MKKISYLLISFILLIKISSCAGYQPIFGSTNFEFKISDYSISGNKEIGNQIYSRLNNLSKSSKNSSETKNVYLFINASKNKSPTAKDSAGKVLSYRTSLSTTIIVKNIITGNEIINENFYYSSVYKAQDQFSETVKLENKNIKNFIDKTYQDFLLKLTENLL
ncbi:MAG: hypothetical protein EVA76_00255 [Candidatus Pelagibacterales bacterium]|nr:MAG: hypothetical protein EVA76_00255 [Pelagibacterales bacterium]